MRPSSSFEQCFSNQCPKKPSGTRIRGHRGRQESAGLVSTDLWHRCPAGSSSRSFIPSSTSILFITFSASSHIPLPGVTLGLDGPPVYEVARFSSSKTASTNTSQGACLQVSRLTAHRQFMIWTFLLLQPHLCPPFAHHIPATPRSSLSIPGVCLQGLAYTNLPSRTLLHTCPWLP